MRKSLDGDDALMLSLRQHPRILVNSHGDIWCLIRKICSINGFLNTTRNIRCHSRIFFRVLHVFNMHGIMRCSVDIWKFIAKRQPTRRIQLTIVTHLFRFLFFAGLLNYCSPMSSTARYMHFKLRISEKCIRAQ